MPRKKRELSAIEVRNLARPGLHAVGGVAGLALHVRASGARSWIIRIKFGGRRHDIGIGGFPDVTLAGARDKARVIREQIEAGDDPLAERKAAKARLMAAATVLTFDEAAGAYLKFKVREFRNAKHAAQWRRSLELYASPVIGKMPVDGVELHHLVAILEPIWSTKTETAKRVRGRIENVLNWASVAGYRSGDNPARWRGNLDTILPRPGKLISVEHHRALPIDAVPKFYADLQQREGMAARALQLLVLTAARSGEVRGARWSEIDTEARVWTIPADRMKAGKEHRVPISDPAIALLKALPHFEGCGLVFPGARGKALSDMALSGVMRRMRVDAVPHGMRSAFRDWCSERTAYPRDVAEMALAHVIENKVEAAYRRGDLFAKRTRLMNEWAAFCTTSKPAADVVAIRGER